MILADNKLFHFFVDNWLAVFLAFFPDEHPTGGPGRKIFATLAAHRQALTGSRFCFLHRAVQYIVHSFPSATDSIYVSFYLHCAQTYDVSDCFLLRRNPSRRFRWCMPLWPSVRACPSNPACWFSPAKRGWCILTYKATTRVLCPGPSPSPCRHIW